MKRLTIFLLSVCLLLSLAACSPNDAPDPYSVKVLYQANDYTSRFAYSFHIGYYTDIGAPEFMGIAPLKGYEEHHLLLFSDSDASVKYQKKPFDPVEGTISENGTSPDKEQQLIQSITQADQALLEGWDQASILVRYLCGNESGTTMIFSDTLHNSFVHIAEFDADGALTRLVEVQKLNNSMITECVVREKSPQ